MLNKFVFITHSPNSVCLGLD